MRRTVIGGAVVALALVLPMSAVADTIFRLDTPADGATVFGLVEVSGWIGDDGQECGTPASWDACPGTIALVSSIHLYVDGAFVAAADLNQARYDVLQAYPWYAGTPFARPGFSTSFNASTLADGPHTLTIWVTFSDSSIRAYGQRTVVVDNRRNQAPFGELEMPGEGQPVNGVYPVTGWALDDGAIASVEVLVDGLSVGPAVTGVHRPDVGNRFPSHPSSDYAGFVRMLNTTTLSNGLHTLAVRATDTQGMSRVIGYRTIQVSNVDYNLPPFGRIDWPIRNHIMYADGCQDPGGYSTPPFQNPRVTELVTGWVLDVGSRTDPGGVAYVQLLLDGVILSDTYTGSEWWSWLGMDVNYYGHPRLDIQRLFFDVPNSKDSGFAFRMDISDLIIRRGFRQGLHYLKIRAGDLEGNVADVDRIPVIFDCNDNPDRPSWGDIEAPEEMEMTSGIVKVEGWAIDYEQVVQVEVWVNGEFIDYVDEMGLPTPHVQARYPWLPSFMTGSAGFRYDLDSQALNLTDGPHYLVIQTEDYWGGRTIVGERIFVLDNPGHGVPVSGAAAIR